MVPIDTGNKCFAQLRQIVATQYRFSCMNNTKWREVQQLIQKHKLFFRVKLITSHTIDSWYNWWSFWDPRGPEIRGGPVSSFELEWLEINPQFLVPRPYLGPDRYIDFTSVVDEALRRIGAPFTCEQEYFRIWGHIPNGSYPALQHGL